MGDRRDQTQVIREPYAIQRMSDQATDTLARAPAHSSIVKPPPPISSSAQARSKAHIITRFKSDSSLPSLGGKKDKTQAMLNLCAARAYRFLFLHSYWDALAA